LSTLGLPFYLTGGTALGRFYLNHRFSEDLDFFVNSDPGFSKLVFIVKGALQKNFYTEIGKAVITEEFARFIVEDKNTFMKVEFVNDVAYRAGKPIHSKFGLIDCPLNILTNKLTAIVGRDEPKDIFDIVTLAASYSFNWIEMFNHAKEKALINEIDVEQRLFSFPVQFLEYVDWLNHPVDKAVFKNNLLKLSDDFILGKDNSLGNKKPCIENAELLLDFKI
jgi:predicted nucleotidyltransferase component of viral defense system